MKPPAPSPARSSSSSKKGGRATALCNLPLLLLIGVIQFLVIYSPAIDRYMVMVTKGKPGFPSLLLDGRRGFKLAEEEETIPWPRVRCDFADPRSDVCELEGAIRIRGSTSEVFIVSPSGTSGDSPNVTGLAPGMNATSWTMQPYTRKGEARVMRGITTVAVRVVAAGDAPPCTVAHGDVPALVYSNGGYCGNYYHDFNDNIVPLFVTARHLGGEVQLLVAQKQGWWFHKYRAIVDGLTNYAAVDLAGDDGDGGEDGGEVRCFRRATIGLRSHKDLSIDPRRAPRNLSMVDFKRFLMWRYALPREHAIRTDDDDEDGGGRRRRRKPRLLVVTRRARRRFVNLPEIVALAEEVGFEVTASDLMSPAPEKKKKKNDGDGGQSRMAEASREVNGHDVLVAVHGSGLTNLVFLPMNAVVVQVVPLGGMEALAMDEYGVPPADMNMRYLQYNITAEESTLSEVYPSTHPVLMDPRPVHSHSWSLVKDVYLGQQDVRVDIARFRPVLLKAMQLLR